MSRTIAELQAAFAPVTNENTNEETNGRDFYKFWKMNVDEQALVRFLPDADQDNPQGFIVENVSHNLTINGKWKKVPCLYHMFGEACPVCAQAQKFYAEDPDDVSGMGKKYYKKREYLAQVVVKESPFEINDEPLIKLVALGPKIYKLIQSSFSSGDLEIPPYEYTGGYDFRIVKSQNGDWADYTLSKFVPKQSNLDQSIVDRLETYNLREQCTPYIDAETLQTLLTAALTGEDVEAPAAQSAAPAQSQAPASDAASTVQNVPANETVAKQPVEAAPAANKADDILAQIRAKALAKKNGTA